MITQPGYRHRFLIDYARNTQVLVLISNNFLYEMPAEKRYRAFLSFPPLGTDGLYFRMALIALKQ